MSFRVARTTMKTVPPPAKQTQKPIATTRRNSKHDLTEESTKFSKCILAEERKKAGFRLRCVVWESDHIEKRFFRGLYYSKHPGPQGPPNLGISSESPLFQPYNLGLKSSFPACFPDRDSFLFCDAGTGLCGLLWKPAYK